MPPLLCNYRIHPLQYPCTVFCTGSFAAILPSPSNLTDIISHPPLFLVPVSAPSPIPAPFPAPPVRTHVHCCQQFVAVVCACSLHVCNQLSDNEAAVLMNWHSVLCCICYLFAMWCAVGCDGHVCYLVVPCCTSLGHHSRCSAGACCRNV